MAANTKKISGPIIAPIKVPKAADLLAGQLREMIVSRELETGDFLPSERQLVEDSGLSRATVREALKSLEAEGLISTKVGRAGGSVVTLPDREAIARSVELFVRTHAIALETLLECRVVLEPALAGMAARNRTDEQMRRIANLHSEFESMIDDVPRYLTLNVEWHLAIAEASGNEPLQAMMEAISNPMRDAMEQRHVSTRPLRATAIAAHARVVDAIREQDSSAAERRMLRHVSDYKTLAIQENQSAGQGASNEPRSKKNGPHT